MCPQMPWCEEVGIVVGGKVLLAEAETHDLGMVWVVGRRCTYHQLRRIRKDLYSPCQT